MAFITVDGGGTWTPFSGRIMRSGVYETDDAAVIAAAASSGLEWVYVSDTPPAGLPIRATPVIVPEGIAAETQPEASAIGTTMVRDAPNADQNPALTGPLTTADLEAPQLTCTEVGCDGRKFPTLASVQSHRRAKHPHLDQTSGLPAVQVPAATPANAPQAKTITGAEDVPGIPTTQDAAPVAPAP